MTTRHEKSKGSRKLIMHRALWIDADYEYIPACGVKFGLPGRVHATVKGQVTCRRCLAQRKKVKRDI